MDNSLQPAFPIFDANGEFHNDQFGLSKREYFAGLAMQGLLANPIHAERLKVNDYWMDTETISKIALEAADALLTQLENK